MVTFFAPGLRFFHEGQMEGWVLHNSMHLGGRRREPASRDIQSFYELVLKGLLRPEFHDGQFRLWQPRPAWDGNPTWNNFICFSWHDGRGNCSLITVNYAGSQGQCYLPIALDLLGDGYVLLSDSLSEARYERSGEELKSRGLYLDLPPWGHHLFKVQSMEVPIQVSKPSTRQKQHRPALRWWHDSGDPGSSSGGPP